MSNSDVFKKSVEIGAVGEQLVIDHLLKEGCTVTDQSQLFNSVDLVVEYKGNTFTVQVKRDVKSAKTHNLFFEQKSISNCKADFVVYVALDDSEILWFKTEHAKILANQKKQRKVEQSKVGSNQRYNGGVIPIRRAHPADFKTMLWVYVDDSELQELMKP